MSKEKKGYVAEDFTHVTPALLSRIESVVADQAHRRYSSSAIYKAHNELFNLKEAVQTCESCLLTRAGNIKKWKEWYDSITPVVPTVQIPVANVGQQADPAANLDPANVLVTGGAPDSLPAASAEATTYEGIVAKYSLGFIPTDVETEKAVLGTYFETGVPAMTDNERAIVLDRYRELTTISQEDQAAALAAAKLGEDGLTDAQRAAALKQSTEQADGLAAVAEGAKRVVLQKIDKDTYVADGEPFYGDFTASAEDVAKGTILNPTTGKAVAPGTYATEDVTKILKIAIGGKASYVDLPAQA